MSRIFITGSTEGLGLAAARALMSAGHEVICHARTSQRAAALADLAPRLGGVVIGDLSSAVETRNLAEQINKLGRMNAVIHNAGVYQEPSRGMTPEGHAKTLAVNTLAPYILTALIERPDRLIYLSSGMHRGGNGSLRDIDWLERPWEPSTAYSESKFFLTALALAVARQWPEVLSNALDPGWVPTRMGGPGAPDDMSLAPVTQAWLAVSDDLDAQVSGEYLYHQQLASVHPAARDTGFQDELLDYCAGLSGVALPGLDLPVPGPAQ